MNKKDKDWLFSKVDTLREISKGIDLSLEYTDLYLTKSMVISIDNFIKEIHKFIRVK